MGQFSWLTRDTNQQVFCEKPKGIYYLLVPPGFGDNIEERDYEGYGEFGGRDVFALVAQ